VILADLITAQELTRGWVHFVAARSKPARGAGELARSGRLHHI